MNKQPYIEKIVAYLNDGFVTYPANIARDVNINGLTFADLQSWTEIAKNALESLESSKRLILMPEGVLSSITSYIENLRNNADTLATNPQNIENYIGNCLSWAEQIIAQSAPYLNLSDNTNYETLATRTSSLLDDSREQLEADTQDIKLQKKTLERLNQKSQKILRGVSSGTLSKNFGELSDSRWNWILLGLGAAATVVGFGLLVYTSLTITAYLTDSLQNNSLDYRIFFIKWTASIPWLLLTSIGLLELRSRIRFRDIYLYRRSVAGSLDGYTETLLARVEDITDPAEKSEARKIVIEYMITAMTELTKSPSMSPDKSSMGIKVRDIAEATFSSQR